MNQPLKSSQNPELSVEELIGELNKKKEFYEKQTDSAYKAYISKQSQLEEIQKSIDEAEAEHQAKMQEIAKEQELAIANFNNSFTDRKQELDQEILNLEDRRKKETFALSELDGQKAHLLQQIAEIKEDIETKNNDRRTILKSYSEEIDKRKEELANYEQDIRNIEPQLETKQKELDLTTQSIADQENELNRSIGVLQEQELLLQGKVREIKSEIVEYEKSIEQSRQEDKDRQVDLMMREQGLDAKRRAFYEERKDFLTEKRQFYATKSMVE